jgi:hypothetical protein
MRLRANQDPLANRWLVATANTAILAALARLIIAGLDPLVHLLPTLRVLQVPVLALPALEVKVSVLVLALVLDLELATAIPSVKSHPWVTN